MLVHCLYLLFFFFSSRRRHTRYWRDWSSDVCSSDLVYIDIAHRAAFMYSFAALVMARLLESSPYAERVQLGASGLVLLFLTLTIFGYLSHGLRDDTDNIFRERTFTTTWYMYLLIAGEIGGFAVILWGFLSRQFGL